MKLNKHIVIISPGFASDEADSTCIPALQSFIKELSLHVERITVIALHYPYSNENYRWNGVQVIPLNGGNKRWKRILLLNQKLRNALNAVSKENKIDVLHSMWLNESSLFASRYSKKMNVPLIMTAHGQDVLSSNYYLNLLDHSSQVTCMSEIQEKLLIDSGFKKVKKIHWGVEKIERSDKQDEIVVVGNLIELKNPLYALEILKMVHSMGSFFKMTFIGDGPLKSELEQRCSESGLDNFVTFTGELKHEETLKRIASSKVLIHPSSFEGFGLVVVEALAAQTHVMSNNVGIAAEVETIYKLTYNVDKDAETLIELMKSKEPSPINFSIKETVQQFLELYTN